MFTLAIFHPETLRPLLVVPNPRAVFSTTRRGDERLRAVIPALQRMEAFSTVFDAAPLATVAVRTNGRTVWSGRVMDADLRRDGTDVGVTVNAVGWVGKLNDVKYTAFWSTTDVRQMRLVTPVELPACVADSRVRINATTAVYVNIAAGSVFQPNDQICVAYLAPHRATSTIQAADVRCWNVPETWLAVDLHGLSTAVPGSAWTIDFTFPNIPRNTTNPISLMFPQAYSAVAIALRVTTAITVDAPTTVVIDNLRLAATYPPITALTIIKTQFPLTFAAGLSNLTDIQNAVFEDANFTDVLDSVLAYDALDYEVVGDNRLVVRYQDDVPTRRRWNVVADAVTIGRDTSTITNNTYARYRSADSSYPLRTERTDDPIARRVYANGIVRDAFIDIDTLDVTVANAARNALLRRRRTGSMRVRASTRMVYTPAMVRVPAWAVRGGDLVTIINAGRGKGGATMTFIVDRTDFDVATQTLTIEAQLDEE